MKTRILAVSLILAANGALAGESAGFASWLETVHKADKNSDGMLTPTEVMYYDATAHEAGFRPFMVDHFAAWDFNGDGMVSMDEISQGMKKAGMTDKDMSRAFFESVGFQPPRSN
jgi:hypothetical protein